MRIHSYWGHFSGDWSEQVDGGPVGKYGSFVSSEWWDGLSSNADIRLHVHDPIFYRATHVSGASWDFAMEYNLNAWNGLSWTPRSNAWISPFTWITVGPSARTLIEQWYASGGNAGQNPPTNYTSQPTDADAALHIQAVRRWTRGGYAMLYEQNSFHLPNTVRYSGQWPRSGFNGGFACYGGAALANAIRALSA
jgi:hypothetical protein